VGTAGDVNGDGYDDVIAGAPRYANGQPDEGAAYVYHGGATGLSSAADWMAEGDFESAEFGRSVATAGDVNGDGYDDVIVGAEFYTEVHWMGGAAYVYYGSAGGLSASADWTVKGEGDTALFGAAVGTAGDVNGDGYGDVIVSAYGLNDGRGRVYLYHGSEAGLGKSPAWTADGTQEWGRLGWSAAAAGDVNGDGYDDVLIGENGYDRQSQGGALEDAGRAYLYNGSATGLAPGPAAWTVEGDQVGAWVGAAVATAGDVNGDGYADVLISAPLHDGAQMDGGRVYLYLGSATGLTEGPADWTVEGDRAGAKLGERLGTAGDLNGDRYADIVLTAQSYDNGHTGEGVAFVYHGSATGLAASPAWVGEGNQTSAAFGVSTGTAGEVNGDGYDDLIVGAFWYDDPLTNEGRAFLFYGSPQSARPALSLALPSLEATLVEGGVLTRTLTLRNTGTGSLRFDLGTTAPLQPDAASAGWQPLHFVSEKVEPGLRAKIQGAPGGEATFLVYLQEQADLSAAYQIDDWEARGWYVQRQLWDTARKSQAGVLTLLDRQVRSHAASRHRSFYIVNAILVSGNVVTLDALAARPDVAHIAAHREHPLPEPIPVDVGARPAPAPRPPAIIRDDRVRGEFGLRGQGIVVANVDSGVEYSHSALIKQYRGTQSGSHDYNWFDATGAFPTAPGDNNGHGTFTMGVMVGLRPSGEEIGVAPGAQWIAAKGCTATNCPDAHLLAAAEWILAPYPLGATPADADPSRRPHIVNNSWGGASGDLWFQGAVAAWRAAGILPAFAAGNCRSGEDPPCPLHSPGDYAGSFSAGATDAVEDAVYAWSARGPSTLTDETKPDVSAPGGAWSTIPGNQIGFMTGTSVASPHTAGCAALVLSADPGLTIAEVEEILEGTAADLGAPGPDPDYGHGRIDCYAAVARALVPWVSFDPASGVVPPGGTQQLTVVYDARGMRAGTFTATTPVYSNDPAAMRVDLPLALNVRPLWSDVHPKPNSHTADAGTKLSLTAGGLVSAESVTDESFRVHGGSQGAIDGTRSVRPDTEGSELAFDPDAPFHPGERVAASLTTGIQVDGAPLGRAYQWQFRVAARGGTATVRDSGQSLGSANSWGAALGDLDGDGDLDAFVANRRQQPNTVWLNDGTGVFRDSGQRLGESDSTGLALGDLDGDGDLDAFVLNADGASHKVWLNDGAGVFGGNGQVLAHTQGVRVALGDLDGDGDLDAFLANWGSEPNLVWLNDGSARFVDSGQRLGATASGEVALGDLDGDGDLDAFVANGSLGTPDQVWLNDGRGEFRDSGQTLGSADSLAVDLGDLDGDGDLDAFVAHRKIGAQPDAIYLNDGEGVFRDSGQRLGTSYANGCALGDLDGDGDLDAVVANARGQANQIWVNDGTGDLGETPVAVGSSNSRAVPLGDLDGDGDLDIWAANSGSHGNRVWLNEGTPALAIAPRSFQEGVDQGTILTHTLTVSNAGSADLSFQLAAVGAQPLPWLAVDPLSGTVHSGDAMAAILTLDAQGMALGEHSAAIRVQSNDPLTPTVDLPVTMTVQPNLRRGWVRGRVTALDTGAPLAATVFVVDRPDWTDTDPGSGAYALWLDAGIYTLQASASGYLSRTTEVEIRAQETITRNLRLRKPGPAQIFMPLAFRQWPGAGWPSVRVDRAPQTGAAVLAIDGHSRVYAAYVVPQGERRDVYFNRSIDMGWSFEAPEQHVGGAGTEAWATYPNIAADRKGHVYVVWEDGRAGWHAYLNRSMDGGATFDGERRVDHSPSAGYPDVAVDDGGRVYVSRYAGWQVYPADVWVDISRDHGARFDAHHKVSDPVGGTISRIASNEAGKVYVVFGAARAYPDLYLARSLDQGNHWVPPVRIGDLGHPYDRDEYWWLGANVVATFDRVHLAWPHHVGGDLWDLYVATSSDWGATFGPAIKVNVGGPVAGARIPALAVVGQTVYVGWDSGRPGDHDLWVSTSNDGGATFGAPERVDDGSRADLRLHWGGLVAQGRALLALWGDNRSGSWHVRFARY
jgi:hypothetical protein